MSDRVQLAVVREQSNRVGCAWYLSWALTEIERDHQSNARRRIAMLGKWIEKMSLYPGRK